MGNVGGQSSAAFERYDPVDDTWTPLAPLKNSRVYFRAIALDGIIYVMGGSADATLTSSVEAYDPSINKWTEKAPMPVPKIQFQTEVVDGKPYVIGGFNPTETTSSVELYDPAKNQWTQKASMKTPRASFQTEIVNGKIYAMGGDNFQVNAMSSVEEYDPSTNQWVSKKDMSTVRSEFQTAVVNVKIIAIGGWKKVGDYSRDKFLSAVEEYDPEADIWTEKAPLPTPRGCFQSIMMGGQLYAMGGADGSGNNKGHELGLASLEEYRFQ